MTYKDWVGLAVNRAKATGVKTIFWLNSERAHDASIIAKVHIYIYVDPSRRVWIP